MSADPQARAGASGSGLMLECAGVWKVFGDGASDLLAERAGAVTLEDLHSRGLIGAVRDASLPGTRRRDLRDHGALRLRQVDPGALHVAPDRAQRRSHSLRRRGPPGHAGEEAHRAAPPRNGHGLPALCPASAPERAGQRRLPPGGAGHGRAGNARGQGHGSHRAGGPERDASATIRASSPVDSSSASGSRAHSRSNPGSGFSTSPSRPSIH